MANVGAFISIAGIIIIIGLLITNSKGSTSVIGATTSGTANIISALEFNNLAAKGGH